MSEVNTKDYSEEVIFEASPHEVYEALMDSDKHAEFTSADADISREIGGQISAWDGYIFGENLELVPDEKIIQKWGTTEWPEGHLSTVTFELQEVDEGTKLTFTHSGIPEEFFDSIKEGWTEHYWVPMEEYFAK